MRALSTKILNPELPVLPHGIELEQVPFIEVEPLRLSDKPTLIPHLIFTSRNGLIGFLNNYSEEALQNRKIYCVGKRTANMLKDLGVEVESCCNNAKMLAHEISETVVPCQMQFFCGNRRRNELIQILGALGFEIDEIVVYETKLSPEKIERRYDAILFFSPTAVESFLLMNELKEEHCICIGETTASALPKEHMNYSLSTEISQKGMIEQLIERTEHDKK